MPTVLRVFGLRVCILTNDHGPAHVHVVGGGKEAKFLLNCPSGPTALYENYGFNRSELTGIQAELEKAIGDLCRKWSEIHGDL
jgi:hypothetical protein